MRAAWGVLISGRGSNLAAILELREEIDVRVVFSSRADAEGRLKARRAGVRDALVPTVAGSKKTDWLKLDHELCELGVTHVFLAGFMKVVPEVFIARWRGRILNLHPSLLPAYAGLESIERAHKDRAPIGVSVHQVIEAVDAGEMVHQRQTLTGDESSLLSLAECEFLVHVDEQRMVKESIRRWSQNLAK